MNRASAAASRVGVYVADSASVAALAGHSGGAGLVLGRDRRGDPMVVNVFRREPMKVVLIGGVRCAQLIAMRAIGVGARALVATARPAAWAGFVRDCGVGPDNLVAIGPGGRPRFAATQSRPQLLVSDLGPTVGQDTQPGGSWRAVLVVRDELTAWDVDVLSKADLVIIQQLTDTEAALVAPTLGVTQAGATWLTRISPEMVAVVSHGGLRWAVLSPTAIERQLLTSVARR